MTTLQQVAAQPGVQHGVCMRHKRLPCRKVHCLLWHAGVVAVVELLQRSKSCYLPAFLALRDQLNKEVATAQENIQFLAVLEEPCTALEKSLPKVCKFRLSFCGIFCLPVGDTMSCLCKYT